jgi:hypothetical protein
MIATGSPSPLPIPPDLDEDHRLTTASLVLVAATQVVFAAVDARALGPVAMWLDLGHALLAALGAAWLWARRRRPSAALCAVLFAVTALYFLPQTWVSELVGARRGATRDALVPHQFLLLGVAILAPGRALVGATLLGTIAASAVGLWLFLTAQKYPAAPGEPGMTLAYAGIAAALLWLRSSRRAKLIMLEQERLRAEALSRVARLFLVIRDQANTPLQTLSVGTELLAERFAGASEVTQPMVRALARLRELSVSLAAIEQQWKLLPEVRTLAASIDDASREVYEAIHGPGQPAPARPG